MGSETTWMYLLVTAELMVLYSRYSNVYFYCFLNVYNASTSVYSLQRVEVNYKVEGEWTLSGIFHQRLYRSV